MEEAKVARKCPLVDLEGMGQQVLSKAEGPMLSCE